MKKVAVALGKFLLNILTIILCFALMASTVVTILVGDMRALTDKDNISTIVSSLLKTSAPDRQTAGLQISGAVRAPDRYLSANSAMAGGMDISALMGGDSGLLVEFIYNTIKEEAGEELPFTLEQVEEFVETSTLDDFIADKSAGLVSDFITGETTTTITMEEITQVLEENAALVEETFNIPIDTTFIEEITNGIKETGMLEKIEEGGLGAILEMTGSNNGPDSESSDGPLSNSSSVNATAIPNNLIELISAISSGELDLSNTNPLTLIAIIRSVSSLETLLICIGLCILLMGLIFLTRWKRYYSAMMVTGVTLFITGGVCMVPAFIVWFAPELILSLLSDMGMGLKLIELVVKITCPISIIVTVFGLALLVGGIVMKCLHSKWAKAKVIGAGEETPVVEAPAEA